MKFLNILKANAEIDRLEQSAAQASELLKKVEEHNTKLAAENAALVQSIEELTAKLSAFERDNADLTKQAADLTEQVAKMGEELDKKASVKAQEIMASLGQPPSPVSTAPVVDDVAAQFAAMKPGPERTAFFRKHKKQLL